MIGADSKVVERKVISILRILKESPQPLGARLLSNKLRDYGIELGERAVRYHLKIMDERGLTYPLERRDGRVITPLGVEELNNALVSDKVGFVLEKIELLSFRTTFDIDTATGMVPVNVSLFKKSRFKTAIAKMKKAFSEGLCVSDRVAVATEGEKLGDVLIPQGKVGLATVCSLIVNGCLLKAGIPIDSKFGGVLQMRNNLPLRFVDLIYYSGSTVDPSEVFIRAGMTDVRNIMSNGEGKVLANFRELPAHCIALTEDIIERLHEAGINGLILMGNPSEATCGISVGLNRVGMILLGGLTPVAAAVESGIEVENRAMSTLLDYGDMASFYTLL
jgi:repressor of nif and glnA expression